MCKRQTIRDTQDTVMQHRQKVHNILSTGPIRQIIANQYRTRIAGKSVAIYNRWETEKYLKR